MQICLCNALKWRLYYCKCLTNYLLPFPDSFNKECNSTTVCSRERTVWLLKSLFLYWEWNAIKLNHSLYTIITPHPPPPWPTSSAHPGSWFSYPVLQWWWRGAGSPCCTRVRQSCQEMINSWQTRGQATAIQHVDTIHLPRLLWNEGEIKDSTWLEHYATFHCCRPLNPKPNL